MSSSVPGTTPPANEIQHTPRSASFKLPPTPWPLFSLVQSAGDSGMFTNTTGLPPPFGAPVTRELTLIPSTSNAPKKSLRGFDPLVSVNRSSSNIITESGQGTGLGSLFASIRRFSSGNVNRLVQNSRKSLFTTPDGLKSAPSRSWVYSASREPRPSFRNLGFQFLMHQSYHPLIIEAISNQLSLIREMAEILEDLTEARMTHIEAVKAVCNKIQNSSTEFDRKKTSYFPATLEDFRNSFLDHLRSEVELQEKALKETRTRVIEPLMCILMHKRSQVSRLDAFRRNADNCLQEASDMTAALHADYCEIYQANRETLQLKTIKDILNWHNEYVLQLHMTNTMKEHYHAVIIPQLMQEFENAIRYNTNVFMQLVSIYFTLQESVTETTNAGFQKLHAKLRDISPDIDVTSIVELLNSNHSLSHWQPVEYLPPDSDCPEILQSEHIIADKLVKHELQTKFVQLKKQFSELSSFVQQNRDVVETLENLEKRSDSESQSLETICKLQDDICRKSDEIRRASIVLAGVSVQLKIIGSEKDNVSDVKFPVGSGAPNIKGLWKRAFQSLRKDKPKREPSLSKRREPPSSSDEIDPVYHLLRCAASKSQSTAIATTGLGPMRSVDRMKPNTVESPNSIQEISYGGECSGKYSPYGNEATSSKKSSSVTFRSPYHGSIFTSSEVEHRQDGRMLLDDLTDATITVRSPARAIGQNILLDSRMKEAPLILDWGETILEGSAEDEKSREAQLAYEQHKRLNARRNMLKNAQKSLSFALEENAVECSMEQKRVQAYNSQHLRPPLNERMKSLSVDDKNDMEERKRWQDSSDQSTSHSSQLSRTPSVRGIRKPSHRELKERFPGETSEQKRTCRTILLSTKSFSLDIPGSEKSEESERVISGSSSPGQRILKSGRGRSGREHPSGSSRNSLSPRSPSKNEVVHPPQDRTREWHTDMQSQPNLDEHRPRHAHQAYPISSAVTHSVGPKFHGGAASSGSINYSYSPYNRRERPTVGNVYLVINDFVPRRRDDLPLRAGQVVRVIEDSDRLWWYGSCDGQVGYFPSTFVHRLRPA